MAENMTDHHPVVNGITTKVIKCGSLEGHDSVVIIVPGNPGCVEFYRDFISAIHSSSGLPVWGISHAGHSPVPPGQKWEASNPDVYTLDGQITHKLVFLTDHVPAHLNVYLIGHSIGCYMILQVMDRLSKTDAGRRLHYLGSSSPPSGFLQEGEGHYKREAHSVLTGSKNKKDTPSNPLSSNIPTSSSEDTAAQEELSQHALVNTENSENKEDSGSKSTVYPVETNRVARSFLLFPTIERMAVSPAGKVVTPWLRYFRQLTVFFVFLLSLLPKRLKSSLLSVYLVFRDRQPPCVLEGLMNVLDPYCVSNILFLANIEMRKVTSLDKELLRRHASRLTFYYGATDRWTPIGYYQGVDNLVGDVAKVLLCEKGHKHAFVFGSVSGSVVGRMVGAWIQETRKA